MASVYAITNHINGKMYIGMVISTRKTVEDRWREHGTAAGGARYLTKAIMRYGKHNFSIEQLAGNLTTEEAIIVEKSFIESYGTTDKSKGYNLTDGGQGTAGFVQSAKQREATSLRMKGIPKTDEQKAKISATKKADPRTMEVSLANAARAKANGTFRGANNSMYGIHVVPWNKGRKATIEERKKISLARIRLGIGRGQNNNMSRTSILRREALKLVSS